MMVNMPEPNRIPQNTESPSAFRTPPPPPTTESGANLQRNDYGASGSRAVLSCAEGLWDCAAAELQWWGTAPFLWGGRRRAQAQH